MREQHERATTKSSLFRDRTSSDEILQLTYNPEFMIVFSHFRFEEVTEFQITSKMSHLKIFVKTNRIFEVFVSEKKLLSKIDPLLRKRHLTIFENFPSNETFYGICIRGPTVLILSDPIVDFA